ncbi:MAG: ORF6N domain-containing protein [Candidatus Omnitrophica bacterium]|nr:ORF6N domain-containing protein [Candidatus Omnitrophota bacterium]
MSKRHSSAHLRVENVEERIFWIHSQKVMLNLHLAELYGVEVKVLTQAVKRNASRFPPDFMFQLTWPETKALRSHFVTLKKSGQSQHELDFTREQSEVRASDAVHFEPTPL